MMTVISLSSRARAMQFDGEEADKSYQAFFVEVLPSAVQIMVPKSAPH